jgi:hypothetical protein
LGLYLVRRLEVTLGGRIAVESEVGRGTTPLVPRPALVFSATTRVWRSCSFASGAMALNKGDVASVYRGTDGMG